MKLLSKYEDYINELKLTEALREFPLYLSKRLRDMLSKIDHDIAKELLAKHSDPESRVKQTFIDIHDEKPDFIMYTMPNKATQALGWENIDDEESLEKKLKENPPELIHVDQDNSPLYKNFRSETRWGRFINASFPNKFPLSIAGGQNKKDIQSFVNLYKALYSRDDKFDLLDMVSGDDIAKWYSSDYYQQYDEGTLGESCMKNMDSDTFDIYTENPDKVNMLIMYGDNRKRDIKARAIVWKLSKPEGRTFMDRVYTNDYSDEQVYIDYAKQNGWLYKSQQGMGSNISITDPVNDTTSSKTLMCEIMPGEYDHYPYCDTMAFYNPNGEIANNTSFNAKYELTDTDGGSYPRDEFEEEPNYVYSKYHGEEINENQAKYCVFGEDWVNADDAIRVWNSGGGENYAVPGNKDIVHSKFDLESGNYDKWFPKEKCIWSDYLNTWLFNRGSQSGAKKVWADLERKKMLLDHSKRENYTFANIDGENWHMDLVEDGKLIDEPAAKITRPVGRPPQGWHRKIEFIDDDGNLFKRGIYIGKAE